VDPNQHDRFVLRQHIRFMINRYEFSVPVDGEDGEPFCFVEQKRLKLKEDIRFYLDQTKEAELMRIKARQRFDPRARYDVTDGSGAKIGEIQKQFGKSLLRSTYLIYGPGGEEVAQATEANVVTAIVRRVIGLVPFIGEFLELIPLPYDFLFLRGEQVIGVDRRRRWKFRDTYDIDMTADAGRALDRRLVLAITVGMDALQAR
jgi:uncharacterized protein YxjI